MTAADILGELFRCMSAPGPMSQDRSSRHGRGIRLIRSLRRLPKPRVKMGSVGEATQGVAPMMNGSKYSFRDNTTANGSTDKEEDPPKKHILLNAFDMSSTCDFFHCSICILLNVMRSAIGHMSPGQWKDPNDRSTTKTGEFSGRQIQFPAW